MTVQNLNQKSAGYGDYYWFGIAVYDSRQALTSSHSRLDRSSRHKKGTGKLIYSLGLATFTKSKLADGEWVSIQGNLMPHVLAGLHEAWKSGYLLDSKDLSDYKFGGAVIGLEVTGLNDVSIALKNLSLVARVVKSQ